MSEQEVSHRLVFTVLGNMATLSVDGIRFSNVTKNFTVEIIDGKLHVKLLDVPGVATDKGVGISTDRNLLMSDKYIKENSADFLEYGSNSVQNKAVTKKSDFGRAGNTEKLHF